MLITLYKIGGVYFRLRGTNAFHACKVKEQRFTAASSRCRQNLKYDNFTSSFGRLRQNIAPKSVPHVQHDYFLHSTNQVIDLWRFRWRCRRQILNSLILCEIQIFTDLKVQSSGFARSETSNIKLKQGHEINATQLFLTDGGIGIFGFAISVNF